MAGIAVVLDLLSRKNPSSYPTHFSASAAAASIAASATPFAARFLFGQPRIPVAYCDAGAALSDDYFSNIQRASADIFQKGSLKYTTKEYYIELKPLFSAFEWKQLAMTSLRSFLMFYLPLLEPSSNTEEDDDDFLQDAHEVQRVDLVVPFQKSVKQIIRETTVVTTRRVLERLAVHHISQRMAWKLLKDVPKSAMRKAERGMPKMVYFFRVCRSTFRGHFLGVAASWLVQVGIEFYRFFSHLTKPEEESNNVDKSEQVKILGKKVTGVTVRCGASLVFASIGAGVGATLFRPSRGQWIGCAVGDLAGPVIVSICLEKVLHTDL
ncbi:ISOPENTENYL-DIPHOSPHATE DELTA-ISOMERASE [Salix purpurea]|uniref:ISOPENTENYL-DIPHOSPHATE DELTA-ISOMERASE n=1 Tax=Salix purpurea TaxID=77065 RepID=A0A9Q1A0V9_SALPP|nr:ISOPENTENYL-DIPHOSPHATE DELTA-ISOMERASE [Salix purpurea]